MRLVNKTKEVELADKLRQPKSLKEKMVGLLGKDSPEAIHFKSRWGIHTLGMKFPIDCIVCDKNMVIRKIGKNIKPGRFFFWSPRFKNVIELPAGTVDETNTEVLDKLSFI